jgi:hypothetical protein
MAQDFIAPGQPMGQPEKKMTYEDLVNELSTSKEDVAWLTEELDYHKKALAQEAAWSKGPSHTAKERLADRLLDQQVPKDSAPVSENLYLTRSKLFELFALIPSLSRKDARRILRDYMDLEALAQGGGNEQIVRSRQEEMLVELQMLRSVGDAPITGMTTVGAIITDRLESDQRINMPAQRKPQGWLNSVPGLGGGDR